MRKRFKILLVLVIITVFASPSVAQYKFFTPKGSFAIEVSLQNSPYNRLPIYQNAITSLAVVGDYVVGGTSADEGLSPYFFTASLSEKKFSHKYAMDSVIKDQQSIRSGFCRSGDQLYVGSIPNGKKEASGHLFKLNITSNGELNISDLGKPVPGEGINALACNDAGTKLYGISFPAGLFFSYDISTGKTKTYSKAAPSDKILHKYHHQYAMTPEDYLSRRLMVDDYGRVYGSMPVNKFFYFDPSADSIHVLKDHLPFVWGRHVLGRIDSWAKSDDGVLYGGNGGDGQLFRLDPSTGAVTNLGKPIMMNRLRGLTFARNGKLYGIAGAPPGYAHLFSYDPDGKGFVDLGNPQFRMVAPGIEQGIAWRGFQFGTIASSEDGKYVVMGEDESLSQLMVFPVAAQ